MGRKRKSQKRPAPAKRVPALDPFAALGRAVYAAARLDSTSTNEIVAPYYVNAIGGAADETLNRWTREIAQNRCEYEFLNEPIAFGAALKTAALTVGLGPTLKVVAAGSVDDPAANANAQRVERLFKSFSDAIGLNEKLRLITMELVYHGEIFLRKVSVDNRFGAAGFDYVLIRPERVGNPYAFGSDPCVYDGIRFDRPGDGGTPVSFFIRRENVNPAYPETIYDEIPADEIIYFYEPILPQQHRGLPPLQSGLPRLAQLRQLAKATLQTMINAARVGVILKCDNPEFLQAYSDAGKNLSVYEDFQTHELGDGIITTPLGYEPAFGDAKYPSSGYAEIKRSTTADVGSALGIGSGKINNDHSAYNFSSAKMDEQIDFVLIQVRQQEIARQILNPIFEDWLAETAAIGNAEAQKIVVASGGVPELVERRWYWREPRSIDSLKDAQAAQILVNMGLMTREEFWARRGKDSTEETARWAAEQREIAPLTAPNAAPVLTLTKEDYDDERSPNGTGTPTNSDV